MEKDDAKPPGVLKEASASGDKSDNRDSRSTDNLLFGDIRGRRGLYQRGVTLLHLYVVMGI